MSIKTAESEPLGVQALRRGFGCYPTGVVSVCAVIGNEPVGIAASSFVPVSMEPPIVSFCIQWSSTTWPKLRTAPRLGLSVLGAGHQDAARSLAAKKGDRFAGLRTLSTDQGALFLHDAAAWLDCSVRDVVPAGDHGIVLLSVHGLRTHDGCEPLIFHASTFRGLRPQP